VAAQERSTSTEGAVVYGEGQWSGWDAAGVWGYGYLCAIGKREVRIGWVFRPHSPFSW
jgi:hypothetical protein